MEPVECYAAKKLVDLFSKITDGESLVNLRNLAVSLAGAYGITLEEAPDIPSPGPRLSLNQEYLPIDLDEKERVWEKYREAYRLAVAVLKVLAEKCRSAQGLEQPH